MSCFKILKAGNGDAMLLKFIGNDGVIKNILIDGGNKRSEYNDFLKPEILKLQNDNENIDLLIITHTDQDHVKGIQYLLSDSDTDKSIIKCVWFNSFMESMDGDGDEYDISFKESCAIQELISEHNIPRKKDLVIENFEEIDVFGAKISLLSPRNIDVKTLINENSLDIASIGGDYHHTLDELIRLNSNIFVKKEEDLDEKMENRVSIAFLFELNSKSILFLGDANPDIVEGSLKKLLQKRNCKTLIVDYVKLSHHASHRSLSLAMLDLIQSNNFIISANGLKSDLPNKLTFAKILNRASKGDEFDYFIFNYDEVIDKLNFSDDEKQKFSFYCEQTNNVNGYLINL